MPYDIIIGRDESELLKFGKEGLIFLGKSYVKMGQTTSLSNNIYLDVAKAHVILVSGKRGSGKSYSLSVIAEEMANLPTEINKRLAVLMLDTMGIFWSMKFPNQRQEELLKEWELEPKGLSVNIYIPKGRAEDYKKKKIPIDYSFSIKPNELTAEGWCSVFDIELTSEIGILIERTIEDLQGDYSIDKIIEKIRKYQKTKQEVKDAAENRFEAVKGWGLFDVKGSEIKDLIKAGEVSILDISVYTDWNIKSLVVGILAKKLLNERITVRKYEEMEAIKEQQHYLKFEEENKKELPLVWIMIDECLPYDSEVITNKAHTKIGDIVKRFENGEKMEVLGYDESNKKYSYYPLEKVYRKGKREIIKLTTETGRELKCTPNHKILTKNGFFYSAIAREVGVPAIYHYDQNRGCKIARLMGHIFGDGWLSVNQTMGFSGKGKDLDLNKIKADLKSIGFSSGKIFSRKTKSSITNHKGEKLDISGLSQSINASRKAFRFFKDLGAPVGNKIIQKVSIPIFLLNGTKEKSEFLGALFGSDGTAPSVDKNIGCDFNPIRFSFNKDNNLRKVGYNYANQIIKLLKDLGIDAKIGIRKGNIRKDGINTMKFVITIDKQIDNMIRFLERVGYRYCERKEIEGNKWLTYLKFRRNKKNQRELLRNKAIELHKKEGLGKTRISRRLGIKEYEARDWIYFNRRAWLPKGLQGFKEWTNERYKNKTIFEKVATKTPAGEEEVFDISVQDVHNFTSNGCIVHNCHEFLPREGTTPASKALTALLREGRQPGISLVLATQQPGEISKDVITQSDIILSHRVTAKLDVEALNSIMQTYLTADILSYINNLPRLKGSAIILDDNSERIYPMRVRAKMSWHGGEAPSAVKVKKKLLDLKL